MSDADRAATDRVSQARSRPRSNHREDRIRSLLQIAGHDLRVIEPRWSAIACHARVDRCRLKERRDRQACLLVHLCCKSVSKIVIDQAIADGDRLMRSHRIGVAVVDVSSDDCYAAGAKGMVEATSLLFGMHPCSGCRGVKRLSDVYHGRAGSDVAGRAGACRGDLARCREHQVGRGAIDARGSVSAHWLWYH